jgi:imidazolonepropionase-like amidohydrolase
MSQLLLTADRLFDGTAVHAYPALRIDGDRILGGVPAPPPDARIPGTAFPGCTILPGLIDTHVHLVFAALDTNLAVIEQVGSETDEQLLDRALANARAALHAGITTVRDCGGRNRVTQEVRERIRRGEAEGADVLCCGMPITTRTGHCHWLGLTADSDAEVETAARRMLAQGADFLKVMATGGNMTPGSDPMRAQYPDATLRLIADIGRSENRCTAAHVLSRSALPGAVAAGVRTVEHCDWRVEEYRYEFLPDLAKRMRDQELFVGLTMSGIARRRFLPQIQRDTSGPVRRLDARFAAERELIGSGVRYTLHSDAGVRLTPIDRFALGLRAAALELQLTPAEVLTAATCTAAAALGLADRGTLAPGRRADLVVVEGNLLTDLACLEKVRAVMKAGRWVVGPTVRTELRSDSLPARRS